MKWYEVQPEFEAGKKIRRKAWSFAWIYLKNGDLYREICGVESKSPGVSMEEILSGDWEVMEEIPEVKLHFTEYYNCPVCKYKNVDFFIDDEKAKCKECGCVVKTLPGEDNYREKIKKHKDWLNEIIERHNEKRRTYMVMGYVDLMHSMEHKKAIFKECLEHLEGV
jgi:hypothetical protein